MTYSYDNYRGYMVIIIGSSLEPGGNHKRFWSFIQSQRKEMSGIPALEAEGEIYSTDRGKAQALNAQFVSVFTRPDSTPLPDKGSSLYQDIPDLDIGLQSIVKQLAALKSTRLAALTMSRQGSSWLCGGSLTYADLHNEAIIWGQHCTHGLAKGHGHWNIQEGQEVISWKLQARESYLYFLQGYGASMWYSVMYIRTCSLKQHHHQQPTWIPWETVMWNSNNTSHKWLGCLPQPCMEVKRIFCF